MTRSAELSEAAWAWIEPLMRSRLRPLARRALHEDRRRRRRTGPPAGHPAHPGQASDAPMMLPLLAHLRVQRTIGRPRTRPDRVLADMAYSSRAIRAHLRTRGIGSVIPEPDDQKAHRKRIGSSGGRPVTYDRAAYRGRNVIERAFNGFNHWRGLATRYDKQPSSTASTMPATCTTAHQPCYSPPPGWNSGQRLPPAGPLVGPGAAGPAQARG